MATEEERLVSVPSDQLVPGHAYEYDVETPGAKAIKDGVPYALASEDDLALYAGANERLAERVRCISRGSRCWGMARRRR